MVVVGWLHLCLDLDVCVIGCRVFCLCWGRILRRMDASRTVSINKHSYIETLFDFPSEFRFPDEAADPLAAFAILTTSMALGSKMNL